jgi:hypothetical protein
MNYEIVTTDFFDRKVKKLSKKYHSFFDDLEFLKKELLKNPLLGQDLGGNTRKVRMAIASKNKGKSGGARVITCNVMVNVENSEIYLLTIYDKEEQGAISKNDVKKLKKISGLL